MALTTVWAGKLHEQGRTTHPLYACVTTVLDLQYNVVIPPPVLERYGPPLASTSALDVRAKYRDMLRYANYEYNPFGIPWRPQFRAMGSVPYLQRVLAAGLFPVVSEDRKQMQVVLHANKGQITVYDPTTGIDALPPVEFKRRWRQHGTPWVFVVWDGYTHPPVSV